MKMRMVVLAIALLLPVAVGACGDKGSDGSGSKKTSSTENLADILERGGMPKAQATCLADAFDDADLSQADIEALSKGDTSTLDATTLRTYAKAAASCFTTTTEK